MKKLLKNHAIQAFAVLATLSMGTLTALAEEEAQPVEDEEEESFKVLPEFLVLDVNVDVLSDYMWRGMMLSGNPVWQPSVDIGFNFGDWGKLTANIWSTFDFTHKTMDHNSINSRKGCSWQETDYKLGYEVDLLGFTWSVGHIWYTYPKKFGSTDQELYAGLSYENPFLTPSFTAYWNYSDSYGNNKGMMYYEFAVEHEFALTDLWAVTPYARLGFGNSHWTAYSTDVESAHAELAEQTIGVSTSYSLTDYLSIGAQINYTWIPSTTLRHYGYMADDKDQLVWGGVNLSLSF